MLIFVFNHAGYLIYFTYGIRKSTEGQLSKETNMKMEIKKPQNGNSSTSIKIHQIETISGQLKQPDRYKGIYAE